MTQEVTQADRDACADCYEATLRGVGFISPESITAAVEKIRAGEADTESEVQAFARHRLSHTEGQGDVVDRIRDMAEVHRLNPSLPAKHAELVSLADDVQAALSTNTQTSALREALLGVRELAIAAHEHWDADRDMKAGKIIMALAGRLPGYDKRADLIETTLTNTSTGASDAAV